MPYLASSNKALKAIASIVDLITLTIRLLTFIPRYLRNLLPNNDSDVGKEWKQFTEKKLDIDTKIMLIQIFDLTQKNLKVEGYYSSIPLNAFEIRSHMKLGNSTV